MTPDEAREQARELLRAVAAASAAVALGELDVSTAVLGRICSAVDLAHQLAAAASEWTIREPVVVPAR